jgi:hypothetical protein
MNIRTATASLGLQGLVWNSFGVAAAATAYAQIGNPNFTVDKITTILGASPGGLSQMILTVAGGGIAPAWAIPGAAVTVNVTKGGITAAFSTIIRDVSASGKTITFAMNPLSGNTFSTAYTAAALDAIAGSVVNTITLTIEAQIAVFSSPGGGVAILVAPAADANGANSPYFYSIAAGAEYTVQAPTGSKFDLASWWIKSASATPTLGIRFI